MWKRIVLLIPATLAFGTANAQIATESVPGAVARRLESLEQAIARLEARLNDRQKDGEMMERCRDGMRGGMDGRMGRRHYPSERQGSPETNR